MDLTSDIFTSILSPVAAFLPPPPPLPPPLPPPPPNTNTDRSPSQWQTSPLNPQSRLTSLSPPTTPSSNNTLPTNNITWRIDGVDSTGRRFHATPSFALHRPPLRIDIYLPPVEGFPPHLREVLKPERAITSPKNQVANFEIGVWLRRVLEKWTASEEMGQGKFEKKWWGLPFGSWIMVQFVGDGGEVEVQLVPEYGVEQGMVAVEGLKRMWEGEVGQGVWEGVEVVEWERVRFGRQVHEVISLVGVDGMEGKGGLVFKSVLEEQRWMYNELKMLMMLEPHPNVVSRPVGIVTKRGRFGNRRGVCGFLLEWFPMGPLRERLLREEYNRTTPMEQKFRWAKQVTQALVHVNGHEQAGFYPDLKPDNILLRENPETGLLDAVLIDLEQRGGWFAWSPPEVAYVEYLEILAGSEEFPDDDLKNEITEQLRQYYGDANYSPAADTRKRYNNDQGGFSAPWLALLRARRDGGKNKDLLEQAQVYMLGKLLWCIFEGQPLVRCGIDHELLRDADPEYESLMTGKARAFPEFKNTPGNLRPLIRACTAAAPEWEMDEEMRRPQGVVVCGDKLYPADSQVGMGDATAEDTLKAARRYWCSEVEQARASMRELLTRRSERTEGEFGLLQQIRMRPLFAEILAELERIRVEPTARRSPDA